MPPEGVIGMGIDVTERKRAQDELQRARRSQLFAALLESAPDAMVVSDRAGTIVFANSETERLFGYPSEELLGRSVALLIPDELRGRVSSVNLLFIGASNQLGAAESGFVAHLTSPVFTVVSGGVACLLVVALVAWRLPELRRYQV